MYEINRETKRKECDPFLFELILIMWLGLLTGAIVHLSIM